LNTASGVAIEGPPEEVVGMIALYYKLIS